MTRIQVTIKGSYEVDPKSYYDEEGVQLDPLKADQENVQTVDPGEVVEWCDTDTVNVRLEYIEDEPFVGKDVLAPRFGINEVHNYTD